jgi:RNA recognition motif-containing protein
MANNLFVGGLPYEATQEELAKLFAACGKVTNVKLIMDRDTGRSKGFGFVEMSTEAEAQAAIKKLNGATLGSRQIFINEARPQEKRPGGFADKPGFVERRSGVKDRRRQQGGFSGEKKSGDKPAWSGEKREGFHGEKKWGSKPGGSGGGKKWGDKPAWGGKKWGGKPGGSGGGGKRPGFSGGKRGGGGKRG